MDTFQHLFIFFSVRLTDEEIKQLGNELETLRKRDEEYLKKYSYLFEWFKKKDNHEHEYYFDDGYKLYLTRTDELLLVDNEGNEVPIHGVKFTVDEKTLECIKSGNDNCYHIEITNP